jgi:hypothetical protein
MMVGEREAWWLAVRTLLRSYESVEIAVLSGQGQACKQKFKHLKNRDIRSMLRESKHFSLTCSMSSRSYRTLLDSNDWGNPRPPTCARRGLHVPTNQKGGFTK